MNVAELLAINDFAGIVLNDQPEFFGSGIFKVCTEDYAVVFSSNVLNIYLFVVESGGSLFMISAICQGGDRIADEKYNGCDSGSDCFYYTGAYRDSVHIINLYFT